MAAVHHGDEFGSSFILRARIKACSFSRTLPSHARCRTGTPPKARVFSTYFSFVVPPPPSPLSPPPPVVPAAAAAAAAAASGSDPCFVRSCHRHVRSSLSSSTVDPDSADLSEPTAPPPPPPLLPRPPPPFAPRGCVLSGSPGGACTARRCLNIWLRDAKRASHIWHACSSSSPDPAPAPAPVMPAAPPPDAPPSPMPLPRSRAHCQPSTRVTRWSPPSTTTWKRDSWSRRNGRSLRSPSLRRRPRPPAVRRECEAGGGKRVAESGKWERKRGKEGVQSNTTKRMEWCR